MRLHTLTTTRLVGGLATLLFCAGIALTAATRDLWPSDDGLTGALLVLYAAMGLVIVRRQPRNAVGWIMIAVALTALFATDVRLYSVLDYRLHGGRLPLGRAALAFIGGWSLFPFLLGLTAILLFPDGRVPSARWRRALWVYAVLATVFMFTQYIPQVGVAPGRPFAIDIHGAVTSQTNTALTSAGWLLVPLFLAFWFAFVGHQVASWRRSSGDRRAQVKWLMSGGAICILGCILVVVGGGGSSPWSRAVGDAGTVALAALPVSIAVGVLKYRLYGIDRLISRTLAYAVLTGILAAFFIATVLVTTRALPFSSPVGVAAATLAAVGLFNPLRGRVQRIVDRRFNRARDDSALMVAAFADRLRDSVDLEAVEASLLGAVERAVEPAHLSLWIRR